MIISRVSENIISLKLHKNKVIIIFGARQVGKTTLLKSLFNNDDSKLWLNGDKLEDRALFEESSMSLLKTYISGKKILIIDEAQRIENIGLKLKIIFDDTDIQIVASGSSSFELANKINEPLTGRKLQYELFPFSFAELSHYHGLMVEHKQLENRLIFGSYPDVVLNDGNRREILDNLANSYLYQDILDWNKIKSSNKLIKLLQALAFQIGSQVSYSELANLTGLNRQTIENYIDLLEKSYVIFKLNSFSRNMRNELKKSRKIYFYDNGIRNVLINNFNPLGLRNDVGSLWENYIISERIKFTSYNQIYCNRYFWRTKYKQEIDYIEERDGSLYAFEFKWNRNKKNKIPNSFIASYPNAEIKTITPDNYTEFIM